MKIQINLFIWYIPYLLTDKYLEKNVEEAELFLNSIKSDETRKNTLYISKNTWYYRD